MTTAKPLDLEAYRRPIVGDHLFPEAQRDMYYSHRVVSAEYVRRSASDIFTHELRRVARDLVDDATSADVATWTSFVALVDKPLLVAWLQATSRGYRLHPHDMPGFAAEEVMRGGAFIYGALTPNVAARSCAETGLCICGSCSTVYRKQRIPY